MAYVNFVKEPPTAANLRRYLNENASIQVAAEAARMHAFEAAWQEADGVDVRFRIDVRQLSVEHQSDGFALTTVAGQRVEPTSGAVEDALNAVHCRLQAFFVQIISEEAKQEWGLVENQSA